MNNSHMPEFNKKEKPFLFMLVGLPGSGKSYLAEKLTSAKNVYRSLCSHSQSEDNSENLLVSRSGDVKIPHIHSSDALRAELFGDENCQGDNNVLFSELHKRMKADLCNGIDVIYDATNIHKKRRIAFLEEFSKIDCIKVCLLVIAPYELCLERNNSRERVVPESVIKKMYLSFCPPAYNEGFDRIEIFYNFSKNHPRSDYTLENFFSGRINADKIEQENKHHSLTIGEHCKAAARYIRDNSETPDKVLTYATYLHDIGKPFTKSFIDSRGNKDTECHYYNHNNCGAYDAFLYLLYPTRFLGLFTYDEVIEISNLIYYHMMPYAAWKDSERARERDRKLLGEDFFNKVMKLHEADKNAH